MTNIFVIASFFYFFFQIDQYCPVNKLCAYALEKINEKHHRRKLHFLHATDRALARSRGVIKEKRQSEKRESNRADSRHNRTYDGKKSLSFLVHGVPRESIKLSDGTT